MYDTYHNSDEAVDVKTKSGICTMYRGIVVHGKYFNPDRVRWLIPQEDYNPT